MILGIVSLLGGGFVTAIVGLILGINGKKKAMEAGAPTGTAQAGIIMAIIVLALSVLVTIVCIACFASLGSNDFWDLFTDDFWYY